MLTKVSTKDMPREEWLERRRKTIGGSDAAAVLGLNEYNSPYSLWCEKTGKLVPEDISDKESVRLGNDLEQYVAERWMEKTGKKVRRERSMIYNSEYPFAHADIDRAVVGEKAGLECKTTSSWEILQQCRDGEYPAHWYAQIVHYLMCTGWDRFHLGVLVLGKGFFEFTIERDDAEIAALAAAESDFWSNVKNNTPPALDGTDATQEALRVVLKDSADGQAVDLTGVSGHILMYNTLKKQITELENDLAMHQAHIMDYMGTASKGTCGDTSISFKTQVRKNFDRKAYEAANGPIPDMYFKESKSRPFKVTVSKKAKEN